MPSSGNHDRPAAATDPPVTEARSQQGGFLTTAVGLHRAWDRAELVVGAALAPAGGRRA